jgi:hypothetical protein
MITAYTDHINVVVLQSKHPRLHRTGGLVEVLLGVNDISSHEHEINLSFDGSVDEPVPSLSRRKSGAIDLLWKSGGHSTEVKVGRAETFNGHVEHRHL